MQKEEDRWWWTRCRGAGTNHLPPLGTDFFDHVLRLIRILLLLAHLHRTTCNILLYLLTDQRPERSIMRYGLCITMQETDVEVGDILMSVFILHRSQQCKRMSRKPMIGIPALFYGGKSLINNASW